MRYWYETQEAAMAPGIGDGWPKVIAAPHKPNVARLVRREGDPAEIAADRDRLAAENRSLAARVAELEAIADRAERLAAYVTEDRYPDEIEDAMGAADSLTWTGSGWAEHLAAVRAVTRAATPDDAAKGEGDKGEGE